jgi:hypothetical protein
MTRRHGYHQTGRVEKVPDIIPRLT